MEELPREYDGQLQSVGQKKNGPVVESPQEVPIQLASDPTPVNVRRISDISVPSRRTDEEIMYSNDLSDDEDYTRGTIGELQLYVKDAAKVKPEDKVAYLMMLAQAQVPDFSLEVEPYTNIRKKTSSKP